MKHSCEVGVSAALVYLPIWNSLSPSLSLGYLHSALEREGIPVKSYDLSPKYKPVMLSSHGDAAGEAAVLAEQILIDCWIRKILETNPKVIGFSCVDSNFRVTEGVCKIIRERYPDVKLVLGGSRFTIQQQYNIDAALKFCDYVVQGEGEEVFPEMVRRLSNGQSAIGMPQVWHKDEGGVSRYGGDAPKAPLDAKAFPNFGDCRLEDYPTNRRISLMFSRGCILNCTFCTNKYNDKSQRARSAENVFEELKLHSKKYDIREYMFNDDSLISNVTLKPLEKFADLAISEGLIYPWSVYGTRVERLLTPEYVAKLRKSGLDDIALGVESFSSNVQRDMGKSSTFELADRCVRMFADEGVKTRSWIIYGYPSETDEDFEATYGWIAQHGHMLKSISVNCFNANERYLGLRPGRVNYFYNASWAWDSEAAPLKKRKERFLRLIALAEEVRARSKGYMEFHVGDPYSVKYFKEWNPETFRFLMEKWAQEDERVRRATEQKSLQA